jgi:hypothetical protein
MKSYKYKSITNILTKQLNRKIFNFMDFGEIQRIKYSNNLYQFPIKQYYNQKRKRVNNEK